MINYLSLVYYLYYCNNVIVYFFFLMFQMFNVCLWVIYCLVRYLEVQEKFYNEMVKVLLIGEKFIVDKFLQFLYVKVVFKEILR